MGFFDQISKSVSDSAASAVSSVSESVGSFISRNAENSLARVGAPPKGNLSVEQIESGETGDTVGIRAATNAIAGMSMQQYMPLIIGGVAVAAFLLLRKK